MAKRRLNYGLVKTLYRAGYTTKEIGYLLSVNSGSISKVLRKEGEPTRQRGKQPTKHPVIDMCNQEETRATVYSLKENGIPTRVISYVVGISEQEIIKWDE